MAVKKSVQRRIDRLEHTCLKTGSLLKYVKDNFQSQMSNELINQINYWIKACEQIGRDQSRRLEKIKAEGKS